MPKMTARDIVETLKKVQVDKVPETREAFAPNVTVVPDHPNVSFDYDEMEEMINHLEKHKMDFLYNERQFIEQTAHRFDMYAEKMFISEKQLKWLKSLYDRS